MITDATGVPTSGIGLPRLYWKINSGAYSPVTATYVSGNTYTFSFGAGAVLGDAISYYIVAQDIVAPTPNIGATPSGGASGFTFNPPACNTPPTSPFSYIIVGTLSETFPLIIGPYVGMDASRPVTFKPKAGVTPTVTGAPTSGIIVLYGCQYIILDGSNTPNGTDRSLTWENTNTAASTYTIGVFNYNYVGTSNCTIKNCNVKASSQVTNSTYGIILNAAGGNYNNIVIDNNAIFSARYGIYYAAEATTPTLIYNNLIHKIRSDGDPGSQNFNPAGIYIYSGGNIKIYFNTIFMSGVTLSSSALSYSSCLSVYSGITLLDVRDNILKNSMQPISGTGNTTYAIYCASANTAFSNINYNDYFVNGINPNIGYLGSARANLAAWQTATGQDANSQNIDPLFVSATDLHPTNAALDNLGYYLASVPKDYTGANRTTTPDIGAYEFGTNPSVNTTAASGVTCSGGTLNGTINANWLTVSSFFDYGTTTAYGTSVAGTPATVTGTASTPISVVLSMPPATTYHYRARGVTSQMLQRMDRTWL
jgi:hypothetical protein